MRINDLDTPVVVVDVDVMERNLRRAADYTRRHGLALRPHTKTHKTPEIARRQVELGAPGIAVAKVGEAEVMADAGLDDILIAYPQVGAQKMHRLMALCERARVRVALDSEESATQIARAAAAAGHTIGILVEVDTGMRRCGLPIGPELVALCRKVRDLPGLEFLGVQVYQGHVRGALAEREKHLVEENARLRRLYDTLSSASLSCAVISGGSTPNLAQSHLLDGLTEVRPGTYVFNDRNTIETGACAMEDVALHVIATVVSTAVSGQAIIDGGSKTFSSDLVHGSAERGHGIAVEDPGVFITRMNEEHGVLDLGAATREYRVGDRVTIVPNHVCTVVNLHDQLALHRAGEVVGAYRVAGRGKLR
ncbi:MAG: alanine racemase [Armatimonadetes bacterium]|nr:alanine racemase [Armatimonadota bacterium]